jgi:hypothetical protein
MDAPNKAEILRNLYLGGRVAEQDDLLFRCFIRHPVLNELVRDRCDIVLGAKGAGKSSLWKEMVSHQATYPDLKGVILRLVTNATGDPEFRDVLEAISKDNIEDEALRVGWRIYLLGQFWAGAEASLSDSEDKKKLSKSFQKYGLTIAESSTIKQAFAFAFAKACTLSEVSLKWKEGFAVKFDDAALRAGQTAAGIPFNQLIDDLDGLLALDGQRVWLVLDRLDELTIGNEAAENAILKGLLLAFRDISDRKNLRAKIFLRDDVYDRVTSLGHFPALTHVRSRASRPISWGIEDLLHLTTRRLVESAEVVALAGVSADISSPQARRTLFYALFPDKVDKGRAAEGFKWICDRITDGNNVVTPRDLLAVLDNARLHQIEFLERGEAQVSRAHLFSEESLRRGVRDAARDNLETRIFAEYPDLRDPIEKFRNQKADQNEVTLENVLGPTWREIVARLKRVGVIYERTRQNVHMWTVPFLYSNALDIRRGAAFHIGEIDDEAAEEQ